MRPTHLFTKFAIAGGLTTAAGLSIVQSALATPYDTPQSIAGTYNMFLLDNPGTASAPFAGTDSHRRVAVAGNAYIDGSAIDGNTISGANPPIVRGNLDPIGGNVFVGGAQTNLSDGVTIPGSLNITGANATLNAAGNGGGRGTPATTYITQSATINDPSYWTAVERSDGAATPVTPLDIFGSSTDITNASHSLTALDGATTVTSSGGVVSITLKANGLNAIDLNVADGSTITGIDITNAAGVTPTGLIVNVNGDDLNFNGGAFDLGSLNATQVLFNFGNGTAIAMQDLTLDCALLAPLATVNFSSGHVDGALIANNHRVPGQTSDIGFNDPLPAYAVMGAGGGMTLASTPEPAAIALFGTGVLVAWFAGRRRIIAAAHA